MDLIFKRYEILLDIGSLFKNVLVLINSHDLNNNVII